MYIILCIFVYRKLTDLEPLNSTNADAVLWINMSSVHYIHTKRFVVELHLFIKDLLQLQTVTYLLLRKLVIIGILLVLICLK